MYLVSIDCFGGALVCPTFEEVCEVLANDLEIGDAATVKPVVMSTAAFDLLPEFEGW